MEKWAFLYYLRDFINWFNYAFELTCDKIKWDISFPMPFPSLYSEKVKLKGNSGGRLQVGNESSKDVSTSVSS